jgi:hypothetical protein
MYKLISCGKQSTSFSFPKFLFYLITVLSVIEVLKGSRSSEKTHTNQTPSKLRSDETSVGFSEKSIWEKLDTIQDIAVLQSRRDTLNCYAYAMDSPIFLHGTFENMKAQPGALAVAVFEKLNQKVPFDRNSVGHSLSTLTMLDSMIMSDALAYETISGEEDVLIPTKSSNPDYIPGGYDLVALMVTKEAVTWFDSDTATFHLSDYHLFKFNKDTGTWFDKDSKRKASDTKMGPSRIQNLPLTVRTSRISGQKVGSEIVRLTKNKVKKESDIYNILNEPTCCIQQLVYEKGVKLYYRKTSNGVGFPVVPTGTSYEQLAFIGK